jgi:hypothetical protein
LALLKELAQSPSNIFLNDLNRSERPPWLANTFFYKASSTASRYMIIQGSERMIGSTWQVKWINLFSQAS